jgi:hypothetical protein
MPRLPTGTASGDPRGRLKETVVVPLILIGSTVLAGCLVFGYGSFVVGFFLMAAGVLGLIAFMSTHGTVLRPGEREAVIEERHHIGKHDDHQH